MSEESFIVNLDEVRQSLLDMPDGIVRDHFPAALEAGSTVIEGAVRSRIPEAEHMTTSAEEYGRLSDDLGTHIETDGLTGHADTGFSRLGYVAVFLEYGHRMVSHDRKQVGFVPAHPILRPAAESAAVPSVEAFEESLRSSLA